MQHSNFQTSLNAKNRANEKLHEIIVHAGTVPYITAHIGSLALKFKSKKSIYKELRRLISLGYFQSKEITTSFGRQKITIYFLTNLGMALAEDLTGVPPVKQGKFSETTHAHTTDIQISRILLTQKGYTNWLGENQIPAKTLQQLSHRPDALANHPSGKLLAFEMERTLKSKKRYQTILAGFKNAIDNGEIKGVIYITPDIFLERILKRTFQNIRGSYIRNGNLIHINNDFLTNHIKITNLKTLEENTNE